MDTNELKLPRLVVTIGPNSQNVKTILKMKSIGADCFRINLSHMNEDNIDQMIDLFSESGIKPCFDTQGAQLRVFTNDSIAIAKNEEVLIKNSNNFMKGEEKRNIIFINHWEEFYKFIDIKDQIRIDVDGLVLEVIDKKENFIFSKSISAGMVERNRAIDILEREIKLNSLTKFDKYILKEKLNKSQNILFLSFVNSASDVKEAKKLCNSDYFFVSKIETKNALLNISEICDVSDAILIDRGDLSREVSISNIPLAVSAVIKEAKKKSVPVYIATNILDSMMKSNLPSRAEISDMYNLLEKGVYGLVLAAETAIGDNPIQSVAVVNYIQKHFLINNLGISGFISQSKKTFKRNISTTLSLVII